MSNVFMQHELLGHFLYLQAEVSSSKTSSAGHCYLTLKDENAEIAAVMWANTYRYFHNNLQTGLVGLFYGKLQLYVKKGTVHFQITSFVAQSALGNQRQQYLKKNFITKN